ncbi:hypothetical protein EV421DRAFT_1900942 [Armillaria borealis]|uniref:Uncharacterized protein n=1 Tax=Armillaria borealis TaxID=47425 RepID=A0AA39JVY9_9AGAR|nr:hypothetical protein EV421DRAFT_1900942 [Armillaria borealis]
MIISQQDTRRVLAFSPSSVLWLFLALLAVVLTLVYPSMRNALSRPSFRLDGYGVGLQVSENIQDSYSSTPAARTLRSQPRIFPLPRVFNSSHCRPHHSLANANADSGCDARTLGDTFSDERLYAFRKGIVRNGIFMQRLYTHTM